MTTEKAIIDRRRVLQLGGALAGGALATSVGINGALARAVDAVDASRSPASSVDWKAVAQAVGGPGQMQSGGVFVVDLPRTDLKITLRGVPIEPDLVLDVEARFMQMGSMTMLMGEIPVLVSELEGVMDSLLGSNFSISALHNHLVGLSTMVLYVHFSGMGDAMTMANNVHTAVARTKAPFSMTSTKTWPAIDVRGIQRVFGDAGEISDKVFQVSVPRNEKITMNGMPVPPTMGVESMALFQSAGGGKAACTGELCLVGTEVPPVAAELRRRGVEVMAIHNHMTTENPRLFFMHTWQVGNAVQLAANIRAALNLTNSKKA